MAMSFFAAPSTLWLLGAPGAGRAMHGEPLGWLGGWAQRLCTTA